MCGFDYEISKKLHTMGDALLSKNTQSQTVIGIVYFVTRRFPISLGLGLPFNTLTKPALVIELTCVPQLALSLAIYSYSFWGGLYATYHQKNHKPMIHSQS